MMKVVLSHGRIFSSSCMPCIASNAFPHTVTEWGMLLGLHCTRLIIPRAQAHTPPSPRSCELFFQRKGVSTLSKPQPHAGPLRTVHFYLATGILPAAEICTRKWKLHPQIGRRAVSYNSDGLSGFLLDVDSQLIYLTCWCEQEQTLNTRHVLSGRNWALVYSLPLPRSLLLHWPVVASADKTWLGEGGCQADWQARLF